MTRQRPWISLALALAAFFASTLCRADLYVIVNARNNTVSLNVDQTCRIFLQKTKRFENDLIAEPVAQEQGMPAREMFNHLVLDRNEQQLKYYWSRKMFSGGDRPPAAVADNAAVITAVAGNQGAIGYINVKPNNPNVKVVMTLQD